MSKILELPVHSIAHSRAGDKGNISNVSLIAYNKNGWENIKINATESKILEIFKHLGATNVTRYELPKLTALNFVIEDALGGGVNSSLRLDRHGKTLSSYLLYHLKLKVSSNMLPDNSPYRIKFKKG
tara:strand:- start:387 stop:767 length:381 start_codon:yes stop_codon:yes gene_type:complete